MVNDRGQLLLVGAILLAVVVVGVVVQLNSLQYNNALGAEAETGTLDRADRAEASTVADLRGLAEAVRRSDPANYEAALRRNLSTYRNYSQNMSAASGDSYVDVRLNVSASINETAIGQSSGKYQAPISGDQDWTAANQSHELTRFWLNVSQKTGANDFVVTIANDTDRWQLRLVFVSGNAFDVETRTPSATGWTEHCSGETTTTIDVLNGTDETGPCDFTGNAPTLAGPYNVSFKNGNSADGGYSLAFVGGRNDTHVGSSSSVLYYPGIDYQYRSPSMAYNRTIVAGGGA